MNDDRLKYFECTGKILKAVPVSTALVVAVSTEAMGRCVNRHKFMTCNEITLERLLAELDPSVGPLVLETVCRDFDNPDVEVRILDMNCYASKASRSERLTA